MLHSLMRRALAHATRRALASSSFAAPTVGPLPSSVRSTSTSYAREMSTLCVLAAPSLLASKPLTDRLRAETPKEFDIVLGSEIEDFKDVIDGAKSRDEVSMLWWFAKKELVEGFMASASVGERVRWMHSGSAGVEHLLAVDAVKNHSAPLSNGKGAFSASLGEWGVFACLYFAKRVDVMRKAQSERRWIREHVGMIEGKRMCVVGYGDIGAHVASRAKAMGMHVDAVRRSPEKTSANDSSVERVVSFAEINDAVKDADYVVVALPATPETEKMINADVLRSMKPSSVLINVGRGSTVDEDALVDALRDKTIAGAALDVFAVEPLPSNHAFYGMENVLISFHCADLTADYHDLALDCFIENATNVVKGQPLTHVVDKALGY
jgi:phosphoglycerate dehydrogenase-like enzyme